MEQHKDHGMEDVGNNEHRSPQGGMEKGEECDQVERSSTCTHELDLNNPPTDYTIIPYIIPPTTEAQDHIYANRQDETTKECHTAMGS